MNKNDIVFKIAIILSVLSLLCSAYSIGYKIGSRSNIQKHVDTYETTVR